ncbi:fungal specific transcription factor domain-containing protein [Metarhizium album ARSEF 1941]|uniref:Fungal specific transcription factor domain-containing protein n=1 Tax=Metarhizium album (strain ARSEF 1941) TaxID=1081103 RepID=A0A0B2WPY6_METAS|nr:fungal specific transcription factor domain-containing protein [Metarhizium album ARSEF 1941]KHN95055.1 fungal specific transcription factor domain-containing protein [Metarhizium album ARSEF 1941]
MEPQRLKQLSICQILNSTMNRPRIIASIQSIGRRDAFDAKRFEPHAPDDSVTAMDGDGSGYNTPGHRPGHVVNPHAQAHGSCDRSEGVSDPGSQTRPRKFVIQSTFGVPRERRSRKSRPCDACRRRKTACIITTEPPCAFCKSRGMICQSTSTTDGPLLRLRSGSEGGSSKPAGTDHSFPGTSPGGSGEWDAADTLASPNTTITTKSSPRPIASPSSVSASAPSDYSPLPGYDAGSSSYPSHADHRGRLKSDIAGIATAGMDIVQPTLNSPESSCLSGEGSFHTLEDNPGRATYFLGRTAEQDPLVLDAFSYGILSETATVDANVVQLRRGGSDADDLPLHFLFLSMGHPKHTNETREQASDAIETKVWPHADVLVRLYFKHVHPVLPIVSKVRFLCRYASNRKSIPGCLRGAVYALASVFWAEDPNTRRGDRFPLEQHEIVDQAHRALRREIENPNFFVLQACLLLLHIQPPPIDAMEAPSTFTLSAQATACAQLIGLHQDPSDWKLDIIEKRLRKKLWWATVVTDCWAAVSHGNPHHIGDTSYNTTMLDIDDVRCDEDVPEELRHLVDSSSWSFDVASGARFLETVKITCLLRKVIDGNFQVDMKMLDLHQRIASRNQLADIHDKLKDWPRLIPSCLVVPRNRDPAISCYNCPLHLTFYATQVLLYRALMHPATKAAKSDPNSNLRRWFPSAIADFAWFTDFFVSINPGDLRGFWGRRK